MSYNSLFIPRFSFTLPKVNKVEKRYNSEIQSLGKRLKQIRIACNITQLDVEIASGINRTEISRIENGLKNVEFLTLVKLAIVYDIQLKDFFCLVEQK